MLPLTATRTGLSATFKIFVIGVLTLALCLPLLMIFGLTSERLERRSAVELELGAVWGQRQTLGGIALVVPYDLPVPTKDGVTLVSGQLIVLPRALAIDGQLVPEVRRRSIFAVNLYRANLTVSGRFALPDLAKLGIGSATPHWDRAVLHFGLSDLRGAVSSTPVAWGDLTTTLEPAGDTGPFGAGLRGTIPRPPDAAGTPFRLEFVAAGSSALRFLPVGDTTEVALRSSWPHPRFAGSFLPTDQSTSASGFSATWRLSALARPYPSAWVQEGPSANGSTAARVTASAFGVDLVTSVDHYQQVSRAIKYGFLFIVMTFGLFMAWEVIGKLRLHPMQYLFVGLALVVFFLLLLSLSEHVRFALAYAIAASATIVAVAGYATRILQAGRAGFAIGGWLTALYGLLFVLLQLEDLALLVGSVAVFVILVATMYLTRSVDWYGVGKGEGSA